MANAAQTVDSLLASLVGMGFELDRCQAAVNCGKLTVNDAVEWLLQGHGAEDTIPSRSAPTLSLNQPSQAGPATQSSDASYLPFSLPPVSAPSSDPPGDSHQGLTHPAVPPTSDESRFQQQDVVSRFSLSEKKRQDKERWEKEQREKAAVEARQARLQAKQARSNILKNIEADKEARHQHGKLPTSLQPETSVGTTPPTQPAATAAEPPGGAKMEASQRATASQESKPMPSAPTMCMLQVRLPSGQSMREKFPSTATLQTVVDFIKSQHSDLIHINLIQPFPHRSFTSRELDSTLEELKLTPTGNLVVKLGTAEPAALQQEAQSLPAASPDRESQPQPTNQQQPPPSLSQLLPHHPPPPAPPHHRSQSSHHSWGHGQALSPGDDSSPANEEQEEEPMEVGGARVDFDDLGGAMDDEEMMGVDEAGVGGAEEAMLWGGPAPHPHPMGAGRAHHDWGDGNRLIDGRRPLNFNYGFGQQGEQGDVEEAPSPQRAAAAALSRLAAAALSQAQSPTSPTDKPITALQDLCLRCVSKRIEGRTRQPVTMLEALPPHLASRLVEELKKAGVLRPKTLNLFLPCHLQYLTLDCYKYTTNELLQAARLHVHISRLSLSACPLLTDQAFLSINSLKKLQYLNVSNNKQLTDGILYSIKDLSNLVTLALEETSVSDEGVKVLASSPSMSQLTHLSLNRTNVSDSMLPFLTVFTNLRSLGLEQTKVSQLDGIEALVSLRSLNIARNRITLQALDRLSRLPELTALNVMLIEGMTGDDVLHHLQGLELKQLQMPDRHTTTNMGLCCIAGMPLVALDLTDYIHITDQGIHHIADMTSLTKLSLNNTKITDVALEYIKGLVELKELHLDRTAVTDHGAMAIGSFRKLEVLSMAATQIKNRFLRSETLNKCEHLTRLNLSKTDVSNRGIEAVQLPHLSLLNLDSTCVTVEGANRMHGCPSLKLVRTNNLRVNRGEDDDDD
ncbi:uncharacterized protein LOC119732159 isoform X2 [Patiria miniata]|uniref:UBX domain-containing protein n=1 Tax=Patiria miniata TaxID=46514 RepID=A0A914ACB7_PATMI|nr:uncharacterized protein LOC119732159 isoform X2 [Patiria miniata]